LKRLREFLISYIEYNAKNHALLSSIEGLNSEGRRLTKVELRRKIFVTVNRLSPKPTKPIELSKWVDVIAHCVETEHLSAYSTREARPDISVNIAMALLEEFLRQSE